jgi:hypothetical protein
VVRRATRQWRHQPPIESGGGEVQFFNERIDDANRVVLANEVIQAPEKQCHLLSFLALRHTSA